MKINILAIAAGLSDRDLLARLETLAGRERESLVELVAHLAALDSRPALYAVHGYGSLFSYCTQALRLSEDAACNRIDAARTCPALPRDPRPAGLRRGHPHHRTAAGPAPHAGESLVGPRRGQGSDSPADRC